MPQPVVLIPGFTGTRLKTGATEDLWLSDGTMKARPEWWRRQMEMQSDGITPREDGERNRNREGLDAIAVLDPERPSTQYFARLIETLLAHGYDSETLRAAPYDWRVGPVGMTQRYDYFDTLRTTIENMPEPVALITHSMGCRVAQYFLNTVTEEWIDRYIGRFVAVSALWLGVPKSIREAVTDVGALGLTPIEGVQPLYQSWGALPWMFPVTEGQYGYMNTSAFAFLGDDEHPLSIVDALTRGGAESTLRFRREYYEENTLFTTPGGAYGDRAVEPPYAGRLDVLHATGQPTEVGAYYKPGSDSAMLLDTAAASNDPNFTVEGGIRMEISGLTLQTIDGSRNSGDGFLPYGSLTYYKVWQKQKPRGDIVGRAFPGCTHYDILENDAFLAEVLTLVGA